MEPKNREGVIKAGGALTTNMDMGIDVVNHPPHYTNGGIECIDAIEAALGHDGFVAFLRGQVIKYQWRLGMKDDPVQDNAKAIWYAKKLEEALLKAGGG